MSHDPYDSSSALAELRLGRVPPREFATQHLGLSTSSFDQLQVQAALLARAQTPYTRLIDSMKGTLSERLQTFLEKPTENPAAIARNKITISAIEQDMQLITQAEASFSDPFKQPAHASPWLAARFKTSWGMVPCNRHAHAKYLENTHSLLVGGLTALHERLYRNPCTSITEALQDSGFLRMRASTGLQYKDHPTFARGDFRIAMRRGGLAMTDSGLSPTDAPQSVCVEAIFSDREMGRIADIRSAFAIITEAADDLGITLHVNPFPIDLGDNLKQLDGVQLQAMYAGIGFAATHGTAMERKPQSELSLTKLLAERPVACSDQELEELAHAFRKVLYNQEEDGWQMHHLFDPPKDVVRTESKVAEFVAANGYLTPEQAKAVVNTWKEHAQTQLARAPENKDKVVVSLFDKTGEWSKPWREAGYQVYQFDIQAGDGVEHLGINTGDVTNFSTEFFNDIFASFDGQEVYCILAANPCTDFAVSGARHFATKDAAGVTALSVELVKKTLAVVEFFKPPIWAIENPTGRIERLSGLPPWTVTFDPNHFGEDYTKRTMLWGRMNGHLPIAPCEATEGSKMHRMYGGKSLATKNARSVTPEGFAYGFFMANNAADNPLLAIGNKYDRLDSKLVAQAINAGLSAAEIDTLVEDHYYFDLDDEAASQALQEAVGNAPQTVKQAYIDPRRTPDTFTKGLIRAAEREFEPSP